MENFISGGPKMKKNVGLRIFYTYTGYGYSMNLRSLNNIATEIAGLTNLGICT